MTPATLSLFGTILTIVIVPIATAILHRVLPGGPAVPTPPASGPALPPPLPAPAPAPAPPLPGFTGPDPLAGHPVLDQIARTLLQLVMAQAATAAAAAPAAVPAPPAAPKA